MPSNADKTSPADASAIQRARARAAAIRAAGDTPHRVLSGRPGEIHDVVDTREAMRLLAGGGYSARLTPNPPSR